MRVNSLAGCVVGAMAIVAISPLTSWAAGPSAGCGNAGWTSGIHTLDHAGVTRTLRIHVPEGYRNNQPAPLIVIFHGWGGDENEFLGFNSVTSEADRRGYILVAPRGLGSGAPDDSPNSWTFSGSATGLDGDRQDADVPGDTDAICGEGTPDYSYPSCMGVKANSCSWTHCQADDVDFALALVEYVKNQLCVDADNVFATGGSNGGMFTWELGQNSASAPTFRAIAPLIGLPHRAYLAGKGKPSDLPALVLTGTLDRVVPPGDWEDPAYTTTSNDDDRFYYTGATAITRRWAAAHGCDISVPAAPFDDGIRKTDCRTYCAGDPGWPRVLDCRARMGHTYSLSWAWKLVMNFFDAHSRQDN